MPVNTGFIRIPVEHKGMRVRDAVEADATGMASLADQPEDVMRNLVHDRTVRVADSSNRGPDEPDEPEGPAETATTDETDGANGESEAGRLRGVVSYDARESVVHVTQLAGDQDAVERLLEEPVRFATGEGMRVEVLVDSDNDTQRSAVETVGFEHAGAGPFFRGKQTVRYRHTGGSQTN
jgi:hypothetical protein